MLDLKKKKPKIPVSRMVHACTVQMLTVSGEYFYSNGSEDFKKQMAW